MDEIHREMLMGIILLFLLVDTIAIFSMPAGSILPISSPTPVPVIETIVPVPTVNPTPPVVASTTPPPVITAVPTPKPIPAREGYVNILSIKESDLVVSKAAPVAVNLLNPPLIIDFDVSAINITDTKYFEYKTKSTVHHDTTNITRPYENAVFVVQVIDNNSSRVVAEDGYGMEYGLQSPKRMSVMERGNYTISLSGMHVNVSLTAEIPKERNVLSVND